MDCINNNLGTFEIRCGFSSIVPQEVNLLLNVQHMLVGIQQYTINTQYDTTARYFIYVTLKIKVSTQA